MATIKKTVFLLFSHGIQVRKQKKFEGTSCLLVTQGFFYHTIFASHIIEKRLVRPIPMCKTDSSPAHSYGQGGLQSGPFLWTRETPVRPIPMCKGDSSPAHSYGQGGLQSNPFLWASVISNPAHSYGQ